MAIYKNREVSVISPMHQLQPPSTIVVRYQDGTHETVSLSGVKFTEDEKKALIKTYPSQFDAVETISDEDLKAVRLGVTPPSDPELQRIAEERSRREAMEKETQKNLEKAKTDADKKINEMVNRKDKPSVVSPQDSTEFYTKKAK